MIQGLAHILESVGAYFRLVFEVVVVVLRHPPKWHLIKDHLYNIGLLSFPVIALTGFSTGMVLSAQSHFQLTDKGLAGATGLMVTKAMLVEMGPILTAFMITGRVGAAMCAELGTMRVTEQIDAMRSMAVNPLRELVAPRFIAGTTMLPILSIFSTAMGILGGYMVSVYYYGMSPNTWLEPLPENITNFDFVSGLFKSFIFGILIVTISCYKGMNTRGGAAGVGQSTTVSVVICYSVILVMNFFITVALNTSYYYIEEIFGKWM
jgi:phospholipid/cholesterol/gamma-HCH transport system permease protein